MTNHGFATRAIHVGQQPEKEFGAVVPPIYLTSTYAQPSPGNPKAYDYSRGGNPNFANLEATIASLEDGKFATVFGSGLGGTTAICSQLQSGNRIIAVNDLYGGTFRLLQKVFSNFGIESVFGNLNDYKWLQTELEKGAALLWIETPTNPLLQLIDIQAVSKMAHQHNALVVVDNTFATPYFQTPLTQGADIVVHSCTKYLGGHTDVIGGVVITNDQQWKQKLDFARLAVGLNPSPFDCWLFTRSLKTLALRMEQHQKNAHQLAIRLESHPRVKKVLYPGLPSHPQYELAERQMKGYSGIISVLLDMKFEQAAKIIASFNLFILAESLGGVESLVNHPASMTHASIPREVRLAAGLEDGLIRFSVGIEDLEDLWQDLEKTLNQV